MNTLKLLLCRLGLHSWLGMDHHIDFGDTRTCRRCGREEEFHPDYWGKSPGVWL